MGVEAKDRTYHIGLFLQNLIVGPGGLALADIAITIGRPGENIDRTCFCPIPFPPAGAFGNLCPFIFRNHPLELQEQPLFRRLSLWGANKNDLNAVTGKFFYQQYLVGVFAAQAIRRIDQNGFYLAFSGQIPDPFQARPGRTRTAPL